MRIVTWNIHRAHAKRNTWDFALSLGADIMLLQEVGQLPMDRLGGYQVISTYPLRRDGGMQRFQSAMLVRGTVGDRIALRVRPEFDHLLPRTERNMYAHLVRLSGGDELGVLHAYNPPWPLERTGGKSIWLTHLLEDVVGSLSEIADSPWVVGGDLNLSETFDQRSIKPRGNKAFLDAMAGTGLTECLRHWQGGLTPTYMHTNKKIVHQIDHLFASKPLLARLRACGTASRDAIFGSSPRLSDHLPIIADFEDPV
jgi:exonuclease III